MTSTILHGRKIVGGCAEGEALVSTQTICGFGGINPRTGIIIDQHNELVGQSFAGKILVVPGAKGSSSFSTFLHVARLAGKAPKAILYNVTTSKMVLGAVVTQAPAMTDFDQDPLTLISTGDWVRVDADNGIVEVIRKGVDPEP